MSRGAKVVLLLLALLILSGILDKYEDKVLKYYQDCDLMERIAQEEWVTLVLKTKENKEK